MPPTAHFRERVLMKQYDIHFFSNADELARAAAAAWLSEIEESNCAGKLYLVALSGGRIAHNLFAATLELAKAKQTSFDRVHFFWADERCVPPDDPESNFNIANDLFFAPLKISPGRIHRVLGEREPEAAAQLAEAELRRIAPQNENRFPVLDLIFLGLGPDGHTASLFPGEPESLINDPAVYRAIRNSPKPPPNRVTLGYSAICAAQKVWMLASGDGKETALRESLSPNGRTPFARILQTKGDVKIFSDIPLR
jgi:6-phosphogluconolactonase